MKKAPRPEDDFRDTLAEANDPVWRLLGRSPLPEPDGWFVARTLSRCRVAAAAKEAPASRRSHLWRWALGMSLGVCLAMLTVTHIQSEQVVSDQQKNVQEAFDIVASFGPDADATPSSDSATWQDSSL